MKLFIPASLLFFTIRATTGVTVTVSLPFNQPSAATRVSSSLVSFSLEQDRWTDWVGTSTRNDFLYNALDNLKQLSGEAPWIRIGADSEDHTNFNPQVEYAETIFPPYSQTIPYPEAKNITVGNGFYEVVSYLPSGTHVIWGVNFRDLNITAAVLETEAIIKAFDSAAILGSGITLDFLEIGNEADLYGGFADRESPYTPGQYVDDWTAFANNLSAVAALSETFGPRFLAGSFAESSHDAQGLSPQGILGAGILNSQPGQLITAISQHHYSGSFCSGNGGLLQDLMTKANIRSNLDSFNSDIQATLQHGLDYVLGETNSYSCHGAPGVSNSAGAAIWALDYVLYAAQIGIARVFFHEGIGYKYNLIQPVALTRSITDGSPLANPLAPHVQPCYYGAIIAAEFIGSSSSSSIVELSIKNTRISGYAIYEYGILARALFINSQAYLYGDINGNRGSIHINLNLAGADLLPTNMTIKRLNIQYADDTSGLRWGGRTYETVDARPSGNATSFSSTVISGLDIRDTEVIMIEFLDISIPARKRFCCLKRD